MNSNIKIAVIGETSYGKTSLVSVILNQVAGQIKMKKSTVNYTCFSESDNPIDDRVADVNSDESDIKCSYIDVGILPFFGSNSRNYRFDVYDSIGFNDIDIDEDNVLFFERYVLPETDILIVMLDATKCISTNSELSYLKKINEYECKKIFVINKVDDPLDEELIDNVSSMIKFLTSNDYCTEPDIVVTSAKYLYDTVFETKYYSFLEHMYKSKENVLATFKYNDLSQKILDYCDTNIRTIYNNKLNHVIENCTSLTKLYDVYKKCYQICDGNIGQFTSYLKKLEYDSDMFDNDMKNWISLMNNQCLDFIFNKYDCIVREENIEVSDIHNKFGNDMSVLAYLVKNMDYNDNQSLFYDILNADTDFADGVYKNYTKVLIDKVDDIIFDHIKKIVDTKGKGSDKTYLALKSMSHKKEYTDKFVSLNKMKYININNSVIDKQILDSNMEYNILGNHLYELCSLFFQKDNNNKGGHELCSSFFSVEESNYSNRDFINDLLKNDFVIFPCSQNGTPLPSDWKTFHQGKSKDIYNKSNKCYFDCKIGMLCGIQSGVVVVRISDDVSFEYWKELVSEHICQMINVPVVNDVKYYIFKWTNQMKQWTSTQNIISCIDKRINIDLLMDGEYIEMPIIELEDRNLRRIAGDMPDHLIDKFNNVFVSEPTSDDDTELETDDDTSNKDVGNSKDERIKGISCRLKMMEFNTYDMNHMAVQCNPDFIRYVPAKMITKELCEIAISNRCYTLEYVPDNMKTVELCKLAISTDPSTIDFVPDEKKTEELCRIALIDLYDFDCDTENIGFEELCKIAVQKDGCALDCVPNNLKTVELCKIALSSDGNSVKNVPKNIVNGELCKLAIENTSFAIEYVPDELLTEELCILAVSKCGVVLEHIPDKLKTFDVCKAAIENDGISLGSIPTEMRTVELCRLAVANNKSAMEYVPSKFKKSACK